MTLLIGKDPNAGKDWRQKRRGWQRMRWLYSITISMDMVLSKLWEMVKDRETWPAASPWGHKELDVTERLNNSNNTCMKWVWNSYPHSNPQCNWVKPALTDQTNINGALTMCSENTNTTKTQILPSNYCLVQGQSHESNPAHCWFPYSLHVKEAFHIFWGVVKNSRICDRIAQLCPTVCDPMDCSLPGSSVPGIFQAKVLEWVAISFSRGSSWPRDRTQVSLIVSKMLYCLNHQGSTKNNRICDRDHLWLKKQNKTKPHKILTLLSFPEKVCWPLVWWENTWGS